MRSVGWIIGWGDLGLEEAYVHLVRGTNITLEARHSLFIGGDYYCTPFGQPKVLSLQPNVQDDEGYLAEPDFPEHRMILYVDGSREDLARAILEAEGSHLLKAPER